MPAPLSVQVQQFTRLRSVILSLQPVPSSPNWLCSQSLFPNHFIGIREHFPIGTIFINSGVPQMPGWATAYLKCSSDCPIPTSRYLFCFPGKVHSGFQLGMPGAHLSLRPAAFAIDFFLGCAAVAVGKRGQSSLSPKKVSVGWQRCLG